MSTTFDHHDTPLPLDYYERKYGLSRTTLWRYRHDGLASLAVGAKIFVREADFIAFLKGRNGQTVNATPLKLAPKSNV